MTDKGSIIRARICRIFERQIENAYHPPEVIKGGLKLDVSALEAHLSSISQIIRGVDIYDFPTDSFQARITDYKQSIL